MTDFTVTTRSNTYNDDGSETETVSTTDFLSKKKAMDFVFTATGYNEVGVDTSIMERRYSDGVMITGTTDIRHTIEGIDFSELRGYLDILAADARNSA